LQRLRVDLKRLHGSCDTTVIDYKECRRFARCARDDVHAERVKVELFGPLIDCDSLDGYWFLAVIGIGKHIDAAFARGILQGALLKRG
jgi:hypothetical protein